MAGAHGTGAAKACSMHPVFRAAARALLLALPLSFAACAAPTDDAAPPSTDDAEVREADLIGPAPHGEAMRYPIVLVHGFNASPTHWGFFGLSEALRADGHKVYAATLPPFQSTEERATYLARTVDQALSEQKTAKVNILAHSMGGLDARVLISSMGYGDRVAVLTTIGTPHKGSLVADAVLDTFDRLRAKDKAIDDFFAWLAKPFSELASDAAARAAFFSLSERAAAEFERKHPDDDRVVYQSVAGVSNVGGIANPKDLDAGNHTYYARTSGKAAYPGKGGQPDKMNVLLGTSATIVSRGLGELRPNDGLVAVDSAKHGLFLGCIPADHLGEVGEDPSKRPDRGTGFSHVRFYRNLAFDLAKRGY